MEDKEVSIIDMANAHMATGRTLTSPPQEGNPTIEKPQDSPIVGNVPTRNDDEAVLSNLLLKVKENKNPSVELKLPSNGFAYNGISTVKISPFTWEDEVNLKTMAEESDPDALMAEILNKYVEGLDINYATLPDRDFILYSIRRVTYGDSYPMEKTCTHEGCGKINKVNLSLSSLPVVYASASLNVDEYTLPDSEQVCVSRHPAVKDEKFINGLRNSYLNLHKFIVSIGGITDSKVIYEFLKRTTTKDINVIHSHVFEETYGMEHLVMFDCAKCGKDNAVRLELTPEFFTPS